MSEHRTGKWSTKKRLFLSFVILGVFAIGFLALYFYMEGEEANRQQEKQVQNEKNAEQEARALLDHFYMDEDRSVMNENVASDIYDKFNETTERIQDEEVRHALTLEAGYAVVFMRAQNKVRNTLVDGVLVEELSDEDIELLEDAVLMAEEELPNFAAVIAPDVEEIKKQHEKRKHAQ